MDGAIAGSRSMPRATRSFDRLPTVSIGVPNGQHDLRSAGKVVCDAWLATYIKP